MKRSEYVERATDAFTSGRIDEETYDAMLLNADIFCDEDDDDTYAEVEYTSEQLESDPIAIEGAKWDDMNYLRRRER